MKIKKRQLARKLRSQGLSYGEIKERMKLSSRSVAYHYVKPLKYELDLKRIQDDELYVTNIGDDCLIKTNYSDLDAKNNTPK